MMTTYRCQTCEAVLGSRYGDGHKCPLCGGDLVPNGTRYVPKMAPRIKLMGGPRWAVVTMPKEEHSSA